MQLFRKSFFFSALFVGNPAFQGEVAGADSCTGADLHSLTNRSKLHRVQAQKGNVDAVQLLAKSKAERST